MITKNLPNDHITLSKELKSIAYPYIKEKIMGPWFNSTVKIAHNNNCILLAKNEDTIVGFLIYKYYKKTNGILLQKMAIQQDYLSKFLGSKLIQFLKDENPDKYIKLYVAKINSKGINFYKKNDFRFIQREDSTSTDIMIYGNYNGPTSK